MTKTKRIAVIGGGISGISILNHLIHHPDYHGQFEIDIYDSSEGMAHGKAFRNDSSHLLINVPSDSMSLKDDLTDFKQWMHRSGYPEERFPSRALFGEYTEDVLNGLLKTDGIRCIYEYVSDILFESGQYTVYTNKHSQVYDAVFMALGQMDYSDPYELKGALGYIHDPYPVTEVLENINGKVGIIGTGLAAIDVFRHLIIEHDQKSLYVFSRSGEMPSVRGTDIETPLKHFTSETIKKEISNGLIPLESLVKLFKKELDHHQVDRHLFNRKTGDPYQDIQYDLKHSDAVGTLQNLIIEANPVMSEAFQYLSRSDKAHFMNVYHPLIDENHSPMPESTGKDIMRWIDEKRLCLYNDMSDVKTENGFTVRVEDDTVHVDCLINATGPVQDIDQDDNPLIQKLADRYIVGHADYGGVIVDKDRRVISPRYGTMEHLYVLGALGVNVDYLANSVRILKENSKTLVDTFYTTEIKH